jgi:hypothetical protein
MLHYDVSSLIHYIYSLNNELAQDEFFQLLDQESGESIQLHLIADKGQR